MAHTKLLIVHSAVLTAALQQYLGAQPVLHPPLAGSIMSAVQANLKDDASDLGGLPPDAHIVAHAINSAGQVSLIIESQTFPWTPDGLPLAKMPVFVPAIAARPAAVPAAAPAVAAEPKVEPPTPEAAAEAR